MSQGEAGQHLQELSAQLQELEQVQSQLQTQIEAAQASQQEVTEAIDALGDLETDDVVQVPLGGGAYVRATIEDIDEVIVDLGADYAAEQTRDGAIDALERRSDHIEEQIEELREGMAEIEADMDELEGRAEQLQQQMMQQQSQQLGNMGLGGQGN